MRYSAMLARTLREAPAGTDTVSASLLARAGFTRQLGAGIYTLLPLGWRTARRIQEILREEMEAINCEELLMPLVQPADLWKETGRWTEVGGEMLRFQDRLERDMLLAPTHEEVATDLVRREVKSYRRLPIAFFQIQTKFRDEPRPRAGLLRGREFLMKDAYSFHATQEDFDRFYNDCYRAYLRVFARCGLDTIIVESSGGYMGGAVSHEFMVEAAAGEDVLLVSPTGNYAVNRDFAVLSLAIPDEEALPIEEVPTPNAKTIDAVAKAVGVGYERTLKAVFYEVNGKLVFVVIRGDLEVNAARLAEYLGVEEVVPANEDLIRKTGAVPGYASPVGLTGDVVVIADRSAQCPNLVAGGNREGYHLKNVNLGRDYQANAVIDVALVKAGMPSPVDGAPLVERRGIEVGNIFSLGTKYSRPLNATFLDENDQEHPVIMGSYGIGVGRLMAAVAEASHDDRGLIWPVTLAPFDAHLLTVGADPEPREIADGLYAALAAAGVETLYDDRDESAGVKFNDADLIGVPYRLTVSGRSLKAGGVEVKRRADSNDQARTLPVSEVVAWLVDEIDAAQMAALRRAEEEVRRAPA
jgi:prolyl-tRNA synthetase